MHCIFQLDTGGAMQLHKLALQRCAISVHYLQENESKGIKEPSLQEELDKIDKGQ
jgi:hypothetical protein